MANRFIGRDASLQQAINQVIEEKLHLSSPSTREFLGVGSIEEGLTMAVGSIVHKSTERLGDPAGISFVWGISRWGSSHVVE
jgi:hypothetical protein